MELNDPELEFEGEAGGRLSAVNFRRESSEVEPANVAISDDPGEPSERKLQPSRSIPQEIALKQFFGRRLLLLLIEV